jgi:Na+/H+ antiporter NhaC
MNNNNNTSEVGLSPLAAVLPFALFVGATITLSFFNAVNINLLVAIGIVAILTGGIITKNGNGYWATIFEYFGSKTAMTATLLWLIVGVYGNILREGHIVEGLVWATGRLETLNETFTVVTFLFSGLFAVSTGSGFGTISAMSLTLFPAGIAVGANPALLGGAILSGAALGDSIAPVSDTAVIAATTQEFEDGGRTADIGGTIKHRLPIVLSASLLACILFYVVGKLLPQSPIGVSSATSDDWLGLTMLLPTLVVIVLSFLRVNIFVSLFSGIVLAVLIGTTMGLFVLSDLVCLEGGNVSGAIVDGIAGMANICILLMVVVSLSGVIIRSGCMNSVLSFMNRHIGHSTILAELSIFSMTAVAGILIAAVNTIANICIAPFVNSIGKQHDLHPYRRATILATVICTFPFVLPYGGCMLLLQKGIETSGCNVSLQATDMLLTPFYPWLLLICSFAACFIRNRK